MSRYGADPGGSGPQVRSIHHQGESDTNEGRNAAQRCSDNPLSQDQSGPVGQVIDRPRNMNRALSLRKPIKRPVKGFRYEEATQNLCMKVILPRSTLLRSVSHRIRRMAADRRPHPRRVAAGR